VCSEEVHACPSCSVSAAADRPGPGRAGALRPAAG
jgi:hypothetical protein